MLCVCARVLFIMYFLLVDVVVICILHIMICQPREITETCHTPAVHTHAKKQHTHHPLPRPVVAAQGQAKGAQASLGGV